MFWLIDSRGLASLIRSEVHEGNKQIMAAIDDLKAEVTSFGSSISAEIAAIAAKLASLPVGTSDADIQAVVSDLKALQTTVDGETAALSGPA